MPLNIYTVQPDYGDGYGEPQFAAFEKEKCVEWVKLQVELINKTQHKNDCQESSYHISNSSVCIDTPPELKFHYAYTDPKDFSTRYRVWTWNSVPIRQQNSSFPNSAIYEKEK